MLQSCTPTTLTHSIYCTITPVPSVQITLLFRVLITSHSLALATTINRAPITQPSTKTRISIHLTALILPTQLRGAQSRHVHIRRIIRSPRSQSDGTRAIGALVRNIYFFSRVDVVDAVDEFTLTCPVVVPEYAVLEIGTSLTACDFLIDYRDRQDGAHGARGVGGDVLRTYGQRWVTCFVVGGEGGCSLGVRAGDTLVGK